MFSFPPPATSPLAHRGKGCSYAAQMFQPSESSPLASSSPTSGTLQARRRREFKSKYSPRSAIPWALSGATEDTPQKQFLRDRFKAQCLERLKEGRAREIQKNRRRTEGPSSDDFDTDDDATMDGDDEDILDDELYRRVMMNDERRAKYSQRVAFEREFGSSIDPGMHEDMETLERDMTGEASACNAPSPPSDFLDDEMIQEYLDELEELERDKERQRDETGMVDLDKEDPVDLEREFTRGSDPQPSPTRSMYSDFYMTSPPSSPSRSGIVTESPPSWNCPFCSTRIPRIHVACRTCMTQDSLEHVDAAWTDSTSHPGWQDRNHVPLATQTPNIGVIMLCGARGCDWCFAL